MLEYYSVIILITYCFMVLIMMNEDCDIQSQHYYLITKDCISVMIHCLNCFISMKLN